MEKQFFKHEDSQFECLNTISANKIVDKMTDTILNFHILLVHEI